METNANRNAESNKMTDNNDAATAASLSLLSSSSSVHHPRLAAALRKNKNTASPRPKKFLTVVLIIAMMAASLVQILVHHYHLVSFSDDSTASASGKSSSTAAINDNNNNKHLVLDPAVWRLAATIRENTTTTTSRASRAPAAINETRSSTGTTLESNPEHATTLNDTGTISVNEMTSRDSAPKSSTESQQQPKLHPLLKLIQDANLILPADNITINMTTGADQQVHIFDNNNNNSNNAVITLPSWSTLQSLYGNLEQPVVVGLDTCAAYRQAVTPAQRYTAVAGMFNTGTNAMEFHLRTNVQGVRRVWQVPWGKHRMPNLVRLSHVAPGMSKENQQHVLPIVMIRDPFHWMQSMCRTPYAAHWPHMTKHCPNLVPTEQDYKRLGGKESFPNGTVPVKVIFSKEQIVYWDSLIHLYNDYYQQYLHNTPSYPRLMVRFEDMLLMPQLVVKHIAECVGVAVDPTDHPFAYQTGSAKGHGSHTTMLKAIIKTADAERRIQGLTEEDIQFAKEHIDTELMQVFRYHVPTSK